MVGRSASGLYWQFYRWVELMVRALPDPIPRMLDCRYYDQTRLVEDVDSCPYSAVRD